MEAAEFNELAALEPTGTGLAVPGVPYPADAGGSAALSPGCSPRRAKSARRRRGCGCDPASPVVTEMIRMAKSPPLMVHTRRMADAITEGAVSRHTIVAQF